MVVVFEGVNRVGKTTIIQKVSELTNIPIFRAFRNTDMEVIKMFCNSNDYDEDVVIMDLLRTMGGSVLLDRSLPSAYVYRSAENRGVISEQILDWWIHKLKEINGLYIYINSPYDSIIKRINNSAVMDENKYDHMTLLYSDIYRKIQSKGVHTLFINNESEIPKHMDIIIDIITSKIRNISNNGVK